MVQERDRAADVAADVVVVLVCVGKALAVSVRVDRVQSAVAGVEVTFAVELVSTALAESLEDHRPLGVFSAIGRHQDFHFGNHVLVDVGDLRAGVAGIHEVGAVKHEGHRAVRLRAVRGVRADRAVVGADDFVVESRALSQAVG